MFVVVVEAKAENVSPTLGILLRFPLLGREYGPTLATLVIL